MCEGFYHRFRVLSVEHAVFILLSNSYLLHLGLTNVGFIQINRFRFVFNPIDFNGGLLSVYCCRFVLFCGRKGGGGWDMPKDICADGPMDSPFFSNDKGPGGNNREEEHKASINKSDTEGSGFSVFENLQLPLREAGETG